ESCPIMREAIARMIPNLRRYAHALLGRWPIAPSFMEGRWRTDRDADDLVRDAVLATLHAQEGKTRPAAQPEAEASLRRALYKNVTLLARQRLIVSSGRSAPLAPRARAPENQDARAPKQARRY